MCVSALMQFSSRKQKSVTPCIKCTDIKDSATSKQVRHKLLACTVDLRGVNTNAAPEM